MSAESAEARVLWAKLDEFWSALRDRPDRGGAIDVVIDTKEIVAGGKPLLGRASQLKLWNRIKYPGPYKWLRLTRSIQWHQPSDIAPFRELLTVKKLDTGYVVRNGNHRVLLARHSGWQRLHVRAYSSDSTVNASAQKVLAFFDDPIATSGGLLSAGLPRHPTGYALSRFDAKCGGCMYAFTRETVWICGRAAMNADAIPWIDEEWRGCEHWCSPCR